METQKQKSQQKFNGVKYSNIVKMLNECKPCCF